MFRPCSGDGKRIRFRRMKNKQLTNFVHCHCYFQFYFISNYSFFLLKKVDSTLIYCFKNFAILYKHLRETTSFTFHAIDTRDSFSEAHQDHYDFVDLLWYLKVVESLFDHSKVCKTSEGTTSEAVSKFNIENGPIVKTAPFCMRRSIWRTSRWAAVGNRYHAISFSVRQTLSFCAEKDSCS